ncbi:PepSY domain-containing protein [Clostridium sp.]|uniref:PepSY domain-containing protein n=1 Tax=Clostridium sp. TaxID=1506 RepID=UPI002FC5E644
MTNKDNINNEKEYIEVENTELIEGNANAHNGSESSKSSCNESFNKVKDSACKHKKKIKKVLIGAIMFAVVCTIGAGGFAYYKIKQSTKYTIEQANDIALKAVPGTIVSSEKEYDDLHVEYEFKIKDDKNMLHEVTVDGANGAILDVDSPEHNHLDDDHIAKDHSNKENSISK